jgi:uncharacterized protein YcnI
MYTAGRRWQESGILIAWGILLTVVTSVWGHSDLDPRQSTPKKWETYTLSVPTETESPTVRIVLHVPLEFEIEVLEHSRVWHITTERDTRGYMRVVSWSGNSIPPQRFETFRFLARNPAAIGTYRWQIEQHYEAGEPATWEALTQIVGLENTGGQRAEEAWRTAQVATTVSLVAMGIAITLIVVTIIGILQSGKRPAGRGDV